MGLLSHCVTCGRKLRDAFFCASCQQAACCWRCLDQHMAEHAAAAASEEQAGEPLQPPDAEPPPPTDVPLRPFTLSPQPR